jgi:hypothetical protein
MKTYFDKLTVWFNNILKHVYDTCDGWGLKIR